MAKRSKRRQTQQNKDHAGCMRGLISMFDFRHDRTTRRLLSDKCIVVKNIIVSESSISKGNTFASSEENDVNAKDIMECEDSTLDGIKTSVKKLMEEELVSEQASTTQTDDVDKMEFFDSECGSQVKDHNHTEEPLKISFDDHEISASCHKASQYGDLETLMKEIIQTYQSRRNQQCDIDRNRTFSVIEEKPSVALEVMMNEKLSEGNVEKYQGSKDFMETFQMLGSNKELFLKFLQDQINANQDENSESMRRSNFVENKPCLPKSDVIRKHRNFFRRRSKSHECLSLKEHDSNFNTNRIVILKPNSSDNQFKLENDVHSQRFLSRFSFMEIKNRFKNVIGKEQRKLETSGKTAIEGSNGWRSPNRDHFYIERFAKRIRRASNLHDSETKQRENGENGDTGGGISSIYVEAKKHLSELLNNGDEELDVMMERLPKSLGNMLSLHESNLLSPCSHPRKENDTGFVTAKIHFERNRDMLVGATPSSRMEDTHSGVAVELEDVENEEEMEVFDVSCEQCSSPETIDDDQHSEIVQVTDEFDSPMCLKPDLIEESEFSCSMGSLGESKIEEPESTGRPSPVSVLEPLFSDNEISPASTSSRCIENTIQPLCIRFEYQDTHPRNHKENEESAFEYVEAVLMASDLNWEEFEKRWFSSYQILDSSLFNEVKIFSSRPLDDQQLLFDCTNEILKEVCDCYLNFFLQLSFIQKKIQPVPEGANLINQVWERMELHLKDNYPLSLDHLVEKDLDLSRTWMDLRSDSREFVYEIEDWIFKDMMDDTIISFFCDSISDEPASQ